MGAVAQPTSDRLRVAMVGLGYFGRFHFNAWRRIDDVEVAAVVERRKEALDFVSGHHGVKQYDELGALFYDENIDLLDIATPPHTHAEIIDAVLGKVRAIVCQKPFCRSLEEARQVTAKAEAAGILLIIHENFRFQPWYRKIKALIENGELGEVRQAHFRLRPGDGEGKGAYLARQPYFREMKRFLIHETGIHFIDVFRYLFGEATNVYADLWRANPAILGEDAGLLILKMGAGVRAVFDGNRTLDHAAENTRLTMGEFTIEGSAGELRLDGMGKLKMRHEGQSIWQDIDYSFSDTDFGGDCVFYFQKHVVEHLRNGGMLETSARDYLNNLIVEEAAYASSEQNRGVQLNYE